jgi:hypothetical protein
MSDSVERVIGNKKELNLPAEGRGGEEVEVVEGNADVQSQPEQSTNTEPSSTDENSHLPNDKA